MASLFQGVPSSLELPAGVPEGVGRPTVSAPVAAVESRPAPSASASSMDVNTLIGEAARDLEAYQRLTAEGRLGEAGQRLESLKRRLEELNRRGR